MKNARVLLIIKIVGFVLILSLVFGGVFSVLKYTDTGGGIGFERMYDLPENTADVISFGSSHCHCTVDQRVLWERFGIPRVSFTAGSQPIDHTASFVEMALEEQNPKVIAVEVNGIFAESISNEYVDIYRSLIGRKWNPSYIVRAWKVADSMNASFDRRFELLTKFPLIHGRYSELSKDDFGTDMPYLMGYRGSFETVPFEKPTVSEWTGIGDIPAEILKETDRIVEMDNSKGARVLFWAAPFIIDCEKQEKLNAFAQYADSKGWDFFDYNRLTDDLEIDFATEFSDTEHLNNLRADKMTTALGEHLKLFYSLDDYRGDNRYIKWDENSRFLNDKDFAHNLNGDLDFNSYLSLELKLTDDYSIGIVTKGNHCVFPEMYGDALQSLGISEEEYAEGGFSS